MLLFDRFCTVRYAFVWQIMYCTLCFCLADYILYVMLFCLADYILYVMLLFGRLCTVRYAFV